MDEDNKDEMKQLAKVSILVLTSLSYSYFISSKVPKGKLRFLSLLPVFSVFTTIPLLLSYLFPISIATLFLTGLGNFKLVLFAFGEGPLSVQPPNHITLIKFTCLALFPIRIKQNDHNPSPQNPKLPLKLLILSILLCLQDLGKKKLHPKLLMAIYCCPVYLLVDIIFGICNTMVHSISNMELETPSNEPYLATSLQDFWGRRWNLMVSNLLRQTIFRPVKSNLGHIMGPWASLPAVLATFTVSGLIHELLFYRITRVSPSWEMTSFFVLHGVCLVVEFGMKRVVRGWVRLHAAVSVPLTVGFVVVTAIWLFFPPLLAGGVDVMATKEIMMLFNLVKKTLKLG